MWNSQEHLEVYMAVPCMGAVLHTLNIRLFPEQLTYIANHAEDKIVFVDDSLVPLLEKVAPSFETVEHYVVVGDGDAGSLPNVIRYEDLLAEQAGAYDYPTLDERTAAGLCYTSGTTGNPKGVLYSHRSNVLHCHGSVHGRHARRHGLGPRAAGRADVPRERLGLPLRLRDGRRRPGDAGPLPAGRAAREADRVRAGHDRGRRADDLDGPAALRGREQARPLEPAERRSAAAPRCPSR